MNVKECFTNYRTKQLLILFRFIIDYFRDFLLDSSFTQVVCAWVTFIFHQLLFNTITFTFSLSLWYLYILSTRLVSMKKKVNGQGRRVKKG